MITAAAAERLRAWRADAPAVLSLYLSVPVDVAEHRGLPARARELIRAAAAREPQAQGRAVSDADIEAVVGAVDQRSQEWLGHTVGLFACARTGLFEAVPMPRSPAEQAVIADRPQIRPLLAALQRHPAFRAAVVDTKHAWVLRISDDEIRMLAERTGPAVRSPQFAGWYGLEAYRVQQRIMELSKQHFRDTIAILARQDDGAGSPLVLGGHDNEITQFVGQLPRAVRQQVAGSFAVDLQTATPARIRELARPVIASWTERTEAAMVRDTLDQPPNVAACTDLEGCLAASRVGAIAALMLPDEVLVPGFACSVCGALSTAPGTCGCEDPDECCRPVTDLLDELANRTLDGGGQVVSVRSAPFTAAARLRFPLSALAPR
jgi:peptide chain release factor subunit 1